MTAYAASEIRRFTRDADHAMVGGVCAGIATHFGFNRFLTRLLYLIFFFAAMPFALVAYLAAVFLVPATSRKHEEYVVTRVVCRRERRKKMSRRERRRAEEEDRREAEDAVRRRARDLEERLARVERRVTSRRYQLEEEFRNL